MVSAILGAYHFAFFAAINPRASVFAAVSAAGGLASLWFGAARSQWHFRFVAHARGWLGLALVAVALVAPPPLPEQLLATWAKSRVRTRLPVSSPMSAPRRQGQAGSVAGGLPSRRFSGASGVGDSQPAGKLPVTNAA